MPEDETAKVYDRWNDKGLVAEIDKRSADYKRGQVEGIEWETSVTKILIPPPNDPN